jgi:sugar fermentation stimulation protein A
MAVRLPFPGDLAPARFLERPNRFLARVRLEGSGWTGAEDGGVVEAHLPDPGRLRELLRPGRRVRVERARTPGRRTGWTLRLVQMPDGSGWVSLDTNLPNRLVQRALEAGALEELSAYRLERSEVTRGGSRFDFLLRSRNPLEEELLLEVKSVTLVEAGVGLFPDAVTARGAQHVGELTDFAREGGRAAVLFVLQRNDAREIRAAASIDPAFAQALAEAEEAGVRILGRRCRVAVDGITLGAAVPVRADLGAGDGRPLLLPPSHGSER